MTTLIIVVKTLLVVFVGIPFALFVLRGLVGGYKYYEVYRRQRKAKEILSEVQKMNRKGGKDGLG